jgi:hypothetical protein
MKMGGLEEAPAGWDPSQVAMPLPTLFGAHPDGKVVLGQVFSEQKRQFDFDTTIQTTGFLEYDGPGRRELMQASKIVMKMGGMVIASLSGNVSEAFFFGPNTNYTWGEIMGQQLDCTCQPIDPETPWPTMYVPTGVAADEKGVSITVFDKPVKADVYRLKLSLPGGGDELFKTTIDLYQESGTPNIVLVNMTYEASAGGFSQSVVSTQEFQNVKVLKPDDPSFIIPAQCPSCSQGPPVKPFPTSCDKPGDLCQCPVTADLPFCGKIVEWPIMMALSLEQTDSFISLTYDMIIKGLTGISVDVSDACKDELKIFLCSFYFSYCDAGFPAFPAFPSFDSCPSDFIHALRQFSEALDQYPQAGDGK